MEKWDELDVRKISANFCMQFQRELDFELVSIEASLEVLAILSYLTRRSGMNYTKNHRLSDVVSNVGYGNNRANEESHMVRRAILGGLAGANWTRLSGTQQTENFFPASENTNARSRRLHSQRRFLEVNLYPRACGSIGDSR